MGTSREITEVEKEFNKIVQSTRNLDKMIWLHGGSHGGEKLRKFEMVKEYMESFDLAWAAFKIAVDQYERAGFAELL